MLSEFIKEAFRGSVAWFIGGAISIGTSIVLFLLGRG